MSSLDRPTSARNSGNRGSASWASKAFANQRKSQSQRRPQSAGRTRGSAEVHDDRSECKQTALELMEEENWPKCGTCCCWRRDNEAPGVAAPGRGWYGFGRAMVCAAGRGNGGNETTGTSPTHTDSHAH